MALQSFDGAGVWIPQLSSVQAFIFGSTYVMDADGEKAVVVIRCPRAGTLDRFDAHVATVTNSPDNGLRFSFQGVSAATGQNDGTILGATNSAFVTYAHTVTTGWKSTNFGETVTVTRGQLIACVVDWAGAFTAGDSVTMSQTSANNRNFPYSLSAAGTKQTGNQFLVALHYTTGYAFIDPDLPGANSATVVTYNSGTATADEWGLAFQVPFPCKLNAILSEVAVAAGADFEVVVYDSDGTSVLATQSHDGDVTGGTSSQFYTSFLQSELTLAANTLYRVTLRPTTANGIGLRYHTFQSAALMDTVEGGSDWYMTSQLNQGGTWTNYNNSTDGFRRPRIALHLTAFDDGVSTGGSAVHIFGG